MGKFDSSVYRVRPLMEQIEKDQNAFAAQLEQETIRLDDDEKKRIADAYCGFTTWQKIQKLLPQIVFADKADITQHDR